MDKLLAQHIDDWTSVRNRNKTKFDNTNNQKYRYRYEACERLILKYSE